MKSIKEKQMLVKWAKVMNEPIDPLLLEEVERYENIQNEIINSVRQNSINDLQEASKVANQFVEKIKEFPVPPTLEEVLHVLKEETNELVQAQSAEAPKEREASPLPTRKTKRTKSLAEQAAEHITKEVKLEEKSDSFQQPNPALVDKNFTSIQKKLKFLEQAISRIAVTGPGSGETRFMFLDDVDRTSFVSDRDTHKVLRYKPNANPAFDQVYFDFLSGDQGPIYSMRYDTSGYTNNANVTAGLTAWNSSRDCLDIYQADGTILQTGLENYIRVYNDTSNTIPNGTFTVFTGVKDSNIEAPTVSGFLANSTALPLISVGVTTTDITSNSLGRATVLGEVRNLDASGANAGNSQSEIWNIGDLLWASPSHAGRLTKYQPTAPNVAVSVAAVVDNDNQNGILLVRPTIFPRLYYGEFFSNQNQTAPNTNFGHHVTFNNVTISSGFSKNQGNTEITAEHTGLFNVRAKLQFTSTNASQQTIYVWGRKNGIDIPDSTIRVSSAGNGFSNAPIWSRNVSMQAGDKISIMWAVSSTDVSLVATSTAFTPNTSSAVFSIYQIDL